MIFNLLLICIRYVGDELQLITYGQIIADQIGYKYHKKLSKLPLYVRYAHPKFKFRQVNIRFSMPQNTLYPLSLCYKTLCPRTSCPKLQYPTRAIKVMKRNNLLKWQQTMFVAFDVRQVTDSIIIIECTYLEYIYMNEY